MKRTIYGVIPELAEACPMRAAAVELNLVPGLNGCSVKGICTIPLRNPAAGKHDNLQLGRHGSFPSSLHNSIT